jgi:hypothetical protein
MTDSRNRLMALPVKGFLLRFLLHLLPRGFVRIRNFAFPRHPATRYAVPICFGRLQAQQRSQLQLHRR